MEEKINEIKSRTDLTNKEKFAEIQKIYQTRNNQLNDQNNQLAEEDNENLIEKCDHYTNNCYIHCKICSKYYKCFRCHDISVSNHKIDRNNDINKIKCIKCYTEQDPNNQCIKCSINFSEYFCIKCSLWTNRTDDITHCDKCKICRLGKEEDLFHCDKCNMCVENYNNSHKCDMYYQSECPICCESLFDSQDSMRILDCKHTIHFKCVQEYIKTKLSDGLIPNCLICKKSLISVDIAEEYFDAIAEQYIINDDIQKWKNQIKCNDCDKESEVDYHYYNKCKYCTSYNTFVQNIIK